MATIEPGWYWTRKIGEGWFGPFPNMQEMLASARRQGAGTVYSTCMGIGPDGKPYAVHVIDWDMNEATGEYKKIGRDHATNHR